MKPTSLLRLHSRQSGVSLVVVLLLLLVMTVIGVAVLRGTLLEQRMSANLADRNMAFQQAESALREAEATVLQRVRATGSLDHVIGANCNPDPGSNATASECGLPANAYSGGGTCAGSAALTAACWRNATDTLGSANKSAGPPQYYIQYSGKRASSGGAGQGGSANEINVGDLSIPEDEKASFMIFARSHDAGANNGRGRAVVVLQGNVVADAN